MAEISIQLSDGEHAFVESQVAAGVFPSVSAYLEALIREDRKRKAWDRVEEQVAEAFQSPAREMRSDDWEDIRRTIAQSGSIRVATLFRDKAEQLVLEGVHSGDPEPMTKADFDAMRQSLREPLTE